MKKRRSGAIVLAAASLVVGAAGITAGTGRLPLLTHAWGTIVSAVPPLPSIPALPGPEPATAPVDAGAPGAAGADAAAPIRRQTAPLSSAQLAAPLVHGAFVTACGAPDDMKVVVKVAVKMGHAVDVKATTTPPNDTVASCVERATRELRWDVSPKTGHATVTY